ncbi:hypothetical protein HOC13_00910 [Candidatus Woesearchaeota archaeon]|jgi:hypothetical protein|nr:hypothetical protein [Candidatus Woesearchaeota archaeon]
MEWDPKKKLAYWSEETQKPFRKQAEQLLSDLTHNQLRVILIPAPRPQFSGHKVRAVESVNPEWYQELYAFHKHFRRDRSERALERIVNNQDQDFKELRNSSLPYTFSYDQIYRDLIFDRLTQGHEEEGYYSPPNKTICQFFNISY